MIDFNKYKTQISLPDFLIQEFGFKPVYGSTKNSPKLEDPDTGMRIVIRKNSQGHYTFFDYHNDDIKGKTILDFLQTKLSENLPGGRTVSIVECAKYLDAYLVSGKFISPDKSTFIMNNETLNKDYVSKTILELKPLKDKSFLTSRGITEETINHNYFRTQLFNKQFFDLNTNTSYTNTAYYLQNQSGISGISQRNENLKGCIGSRSDSVCCSVLNKEIPLENLVITESWIDSMSHYQLIKNPSTLYISTEGNLTEGQIDFIQNAINTFNPKTIDIPFDNDLIGNYYSCKVIGKLLLPDGYFSEDKQSPCYKHNLKNLNFEISKNDDTKSGSASVVIPNNDEISEPFITAAIHSQNRLLNQTQPGSDVFKISSLFEDKDNKKLVISFPSNYESFAALFHIIKDVKFQDLNSIQRNLPITKDFNDDLKTVEGIHKHWKITQNNNQFSVTFKDKFKFNLSDDQINKYRLSGLQNNLQL